MSSAVAEAPVVNVYTGPNVNRGAIVYWYRGADKKNDPEVAFVTTSNGRGGLSVLVMPRYGTLPERHEGVLHVSDPIWDGRKEMAERNGGWDYHPDSLRLQSLEARVALLEETLVDRIDDTTPAAKEAKAAFVPSDADRKRVLEMHAEGMDPYDIRRKMGMHWKKALVESVINGQ